MTHNIIGGTIKDQSLDYATMSKTETEARCVVECDSCGKVFPAKVRVDGSPRPIGVATCTCGSETFRQLGG